MRGADPQVPGHPRRPAAAVQGQPLRRVPAGRRLPPSFASCRWPPFPGAVFKQAAAFPAVILSLPAGPSPGRRVPRHRVRNLRIRLRLRLHPVKGHATAFELWWRWGRFAAFRHAARTRPALPFGQRLLTEVAGYSVLAGRAHYRHGLRLPLDEHAVTFSPPRGGKTGWLARIILRYPGPVISTTTKHDVYELTAAVRAERRRG